MTIDEWARRVSADRVGLQDRMCEFPDGIVVVWVVRRPRWDRTRVDVNDGGRKPMSASRLGSGGLCSGAKRNCRLAAHTYRLVIPLRRLEADSC